MVGQIMQFLSPLVASRHNVYNVLVLYDLGEQLGLDRVFCVVLKPPHS